MFLPKIKIRLKNSSKVFFKLVNKFSLSRMKLIYKILLMREINLLKSIVIFYILKVCQVSIMQGWKRQLRKMKFFYRLVQEWTILISKKICEHSLVL